MKIVVYDKVVHGSSDNVNRKFLCRDQTKETDK